MKNILLIGNALLDHLIYSKEPLLERCCNKVTTTINSGGSIRNIAHNLGLLGCPVHFLGVWGNDKHALAMKTELKSLGISCHGPSLQKSTPIFTAIFSDNINLTLSGLTQDFLLDENYDFPYQDYDYLITNTTNEDLLEHICKINPFIRILFIGHLPAFRFNDNLDGIIINRQEFFIEQEDDDYPSTARTYPGWMIVTLDRAGLFFYKDLDQGYRTNTFEKEGGYPVGCGDALAAGMVYQLQQGTAFVNAVDYAHQLAELVFQTPTVTIPKER